jgi:hypothetical protein
MAWDIGTLWIRPGESARRWFTFGPDANPVWVGPQVVLPRANSVRSMIAVRDPGTQQTSTGGTVYWVTIANISPPGEWARCNITGGGVV